jgi:HSP20 family molecular chaperone IbpA
MSSPRSAPKKDLRTYQTPEVFSESERPEFLKQFREAVQQRAYDLFEQHGSGHGKDVSHWLQAENELATQLPDIREAAGWFTVNASVPEMSADQVKVCLNEARAIIQAERLVGSNATPGERQSRYFVAQWPEGIEPSSARAYIANGILTLLVRKADGADAGASSAEINSKSETRQKKSPAPND